MALTTAKTTIPKFNPWTDHRRSTYQTQYNDPNTSAARKQAIDSKWKFSWDPNTDPRRQQYLDEYNNAATPDPRKQAIDARWGFSKIAPTPTTPAPTTPTVPTQTPATTTNPNAMFPGTRAFEPRNYEGSPLYQFQLNKGTESLNRLMAARGWTGSRKEIQENKDFIGQLGANEAVRAQGVSQQEADRLMTMQENESNRLERQGNNQYDRVMRLLELMSSQSPMSMAYGATGNLADLTSAFGKGQAGYTSSLYGRSFGGGGGGGGGSSATIQPFASGPDYSALMASQIKGQQAASNAQTGLLNSVLASFFN